MKERMFSPEFKYLEEVRIPKIDSQEICSTVLSLKEEFTNSSSYEECRNKLFEYFDYQDDFITAISLISLRYTIDTTDSEYAKLNDMVDEIVPEITDAFNSFEKEIIHSSYRKELEAEIGSLYFQKLALSQKTFSKEIVEELKEENRLQTKYDALIASAKIPFDGEVLNLAQLGKYRISLDRNERRRGEEAHVSFFAQNRKEIEKIYDDMVHVRTKIAKKLG